MLTKIEKFHNWKRYALNRAFVNSFKTRPCDDCKGWYEPWQMDFDHREPKKKKCDIATMIVSASRKTLLAEIKKCDVVCSNCHRDRTHKRRALTKSRSHVILGRRLKL